MSHVFISHASEDAALAERVRVVLEQRGMRCWIAPRDIRPGDSYADSIVRAIETSDAFVLLLSSAANESDHVFRELEMASASARRVVPVLVAPVTPSRRFRFFIASNQWLAAAPEDDGAWIEALARTLEESGTDGVETPTGTAGSSPPAPGATAESEGVAGGVPGTGSRLTSWARRHVIWIVAAAAICGLAVVGAIMLSSGEGQPPEGNPRDVARLKSHVPFEGCQAVELTQPSEKAELLCRAAETGLGSTWFELYDSEDKASGRYEALRRSASVERGTEAAAGCRAKMPAESDYRVADQNNQGRLLCHVDNEGQIDFVWSRPDLRIVAIAQVANSTRDKVFEWWRLKAGYR
jgi:hypothetical protein